MTEHFVLLIMENLCSLQMVVNSVQTGLDATFQEIGTWSPELIRWQFFASSTGMFRIHPGIAQEKCYDFDPRSRYWYVSASTGPKDIVILLDTSESMSFVPPSSGTSETLFKLAKSAIKHVLRTLNFVDYVAIVLFSTEANQLTIQGKSTLMKATRANLFDLMEELDKVTLDLHTNFEAGFRLAFDILDRSARVGRTANCHKTVLFLTDGAPTRGETDAAKLRNIVQQFNTDSDGNKIATIFTYSIGQYAETAITKQIACDAGGVWSQIEDVETSSLTEQLSQYYNYYGSLQKGETNIMWTEPIMDAFGADEVVTAAKLIITKEPGEMGSNNISSSVIGVVGMHISVEGLLAKDTSSSREDFLTLLESLALKCPQIEAGDNCALESLRQHVFKDDVLTYRQDESKLCNLNSAQECLLPNNTICHDRTFQYDECEQQKLENQDYVEASCCGSYDKSCPISSACSVSFAQWLLSICALSMLVGS
uniref:Voltage-dependent calcium channel subunit alpha-2/delta-3-like n=1 Tax=Saccoglossus kowalevskii TaxID=10224 RepID=A0ABM0LU53_SACKO|nr:PREDICTED: voltage-dependent calcium channel subunit alpha-2/delta-3-like [Saccoglossus kowalevskii]